MSRHRIEDGGNSPADIIKRIERARRADSTREGIARAYRRLDEALTKATDKMCEIGLLPASTAPARAPPAPTGDSTRRASALAATITTPKTLGIPGQRKYLADKASAACAPTCSLGWLR